MCAPADTAPPAAPPTPTPEPDADLASAWLDDEDAGVLSPIDAAIDELSPTEAHRLAHSGKATLVDIRPMREHLASHPPHAICIPAGEPGPMGLLFHFREHFEADVAARIDVSGGKRVILLCDVGVISKVTVSRLARSGVEAGVVAGGYVAWSQDEALPREGDAVDEALAEAPLWCEPWSDWADGPAEMQPVLERIAPDEGGAAEDDGFDDMDGGLGGAIEGDAAAALEHADNVPPPPSPPPPPPESTELDLDELSKLLGDGQSTELPNWGSGVASPGASGGVGKSSYYATSGTSYGGPSRTPKGVKQRRTRGGLPPAWLVDVSHLDMGEQLESGAISKLSVKELKSFLYYREATLSGPKATLIERVRDIVKEESGRATEGAAEDAGDAAGVSIVGDVEVSPPANTANGASAPTAAALDEDEDAQIRALFGDLGDS